MKNNVFDLVETEFAIRYVAGNCEETSATIHTFSSFAPIAVSISRGIIENNLSTKKEIWYTQIETITNDTFSEIKNNTEPSNLNVLNLARNDLKTLKPGTFKGLQKLRALRLDGNQLEDINGVVSSLSNLEWFNVSSNNLEWFDYAFLPSNISWLDISSNKIGELGNFYQLKVSLITES